MDLCDALCGQLIGDKMSCHQWSNLWLTLWETIYSVVGRLLSDCGRHRDNTEHPLAEYPYSWDVCLQDMSAELAGT